MSVSHHRTIYFLVIFVFLSVIVVAVTNKPCTKLSCLQMDKLASYKQKEIYEDTGSLFRGLYERGDEHLRVEIRSGIEASEAQRGIDNQVAQIKTQYADTRAPYPGEITKAIACGSQFQPIYRHESVNGLSMTFVESFLTDRLTYGACTDEQAVNRSVLSLFYCPNTKQFYQLEFIAPVKLSADRQPKYDAILQSIRCK